MYTNIGRKVVALGSVDPLEMEDEDGPRKSDHRIAYSTFKLTREEVFRWESYSYRHYSQDAVEKLKRWIVLHHWAEVLGEDGPENKARAYQETVAGAIEDCFPLKRPGGRRVTTCPG